ncbi:probable E3 ubiquitin-protein ligase HECTD2 [Caerostris extrusa]|uniref:HECT-type E3 ubiquitin transferase n=1 Tax=Caerostris extrusa TaxID=172846 RepID=A0AAV4Q504_CAEEX|nr:probable E3 ubiquitin-protein ligase HECTD2 [Caerostris extrusa]
MSTNSPSEKLLAILNPERILGNLKELQFRFAETVPEIHDGSDRVPVGGMGEMTFKISALNHNTDMLPISHTCFNQLVLPRYKNRDILREKLTIAISNAEGFGLE